MMRMNGERRGGLPMRHITITALFVMALVAVPTKPSHGIELLRSGDGTLLDAGGGGTNDVDGDGVADLIFATNGASPAVQVLSYDGSTLFMYTPQRTQICSSCDATWGWNYAEFADVDSLAGTELLLYWSTTSANFVYGATVVSHTGTILVTFTNQSVRLVRVGGNGTDQLFVATGSESAPTWELWGYTPPSMAVEGGLGRSGNGLSGGPELAIRPNPVHGRAMISLSQVAALPLNAEVFDARGRLVRTLTVPAGRQAVAWDGRDAHGRMLPSGNYYYQRVGGGAFRKLVILR